MDYFELCHKDKENNITSYIFEELKARVDKGLATSIEKKVYDIFNSDFGSVLAYGGVWYISKNSHLTKLPNYFYRWLESYCKKTYNILPLFSHNSRYN